VFWRPINLLTGKTTDGSPYFRKPGTDQVYGDSQQCNFMCLTNSNKQTSKIDDRRYETNMAKSDQVFQQSLDGKVILLKECFSISTSSKAVKFFLSQSTYKISEK